MIADIKGFDSRKDAYLNFNWIPLTGRQWVDPVREAKAKETEVTNNFDTLANTCASKDQDWEEVLIQRARELKKKKDLEEKYGIEFPEVGKSQGNMGEPREADDELLRVVK